MKKKFIGFVGILSLVSFWISAQTLSGKITTKDGVALSNVSVRILNGNGGTLTNEKGDFQLVGLPSGNQTLLVTLVGYATLSQVISLEKKANKNLDFQLVEANNTLEEVVVTAEKTESMAQKLPYAITALSGQQVQNYRLWNLQDLSGLIPNLSLNNAGDERNVTSIRGIVNATYDQTVATVIDGVVQFDNDTYLSQLIDIERIEVLRGPQATLYGRNSMGGVINIITRQPSNTMKSAVEVSAGNYGLIRYGVRSSLPFVKDKLWLGVALNGEKRNGYYTNKFNGQTFDNLKSFYFSSNLKYQASKHLSATLNVKVSTRRNDGSYPLVGRDSLAFAEPFKVNLNRLATDKDNTLNASLVLNYSGKKVNVSSISAFQQNTRYYTDTLDADFGPRDFAAVLVKNQDGYNTVGVFTQEIKASSAASELPLKWTAGAYFFTQNAPEQQGLLSILAAPVVLNNGSKVFAPYLTDTRTKGTRTGASLYGQASYEIGKMTFTAGLRYDYEQKDLTRFLDIVKKGQILQTTEATFAYRPAGVVSPKISVAFRPTDNQTYYFSYTQGFRSGGLNDAATKPELVQFNPERSDNLELGIKNTYFNNRLRSNLTFFFINWNDIQVPTYVPGFQAVVQNAGKARSSGVEYELSAIVAKGFQADLSVGYTDATYKTLRVANAFRPQNDDLSGKKQIFTPNYTFNLALQYTHELKSPANLGFLARIEYKQMGTTYYNLANTVKQDSYSIVNAKVGMTSKHFDLMIWGRNLAETIYLNYGYSFPGINPVSLGTPRTAGITGTVKF